jgi:hypothetical protein
VARSGYGSGGPVFEFEHNSIAALSPHHEKELAVTAEKSP